MERETIKIELPVSKRTVEIKTYLTGREKRALTNVYLQGDLSFDQAGGNVKGLKGALIEQAENLAFQTVIVTIDGKKEGEINIVETVLDMQAKDYNFIVTEVNKISADTAYEEKKTV